MQLGIETHDGRSLAEALTGEGEAPADFKGIRETFDRDGINWLIRSLRRPRDPTFGHDEQRHDLGLAQRPA